MNGLDEPMFQIVTIRYLSPLDHKLRSQRIDKYPLHDFFSREEVVAALPASVPRFAGVAPFFTLNRS